MTYTPDQLRKWADDVERMGHLPTAQIYRAYAAALEEIERLNAAWKAQQFHLEAEERESAHWQERAEKAERRAERLKWHVEAMEAELEFIRIGAQKEGKTTFGIGKVLRDYRAEFKGE